MSDVSCVPIAHYLKLPSFQRSIAQDILFETCHLGRLSQWSYIADMGRTSGTPVEISSHFDKSENYECCGVPRFGESWTMFAYTNIDPEHIWELLWRYTKSKPLES